MGFQDSELVDLKEMKLNKRASGLYNDVSSIIYVIKFSNIKIKFC